MVFVQKLLGGERRMTGVGAAKFGGLAVLILAVAGAPASSATLWGDAASGGATMAAAPTVAVYDEVPCPETRASKTATHHVVKPHRRKRRVLAAHRVVKTPHPRVIAAATAHHVRRVRRRPHIVRAAVSPPLVRRCSVLRRAPLTLASLALPATAAALAPALASSTAAFADPTVPEQAGLPGTAPFAGAQKLEGGGGVSTLTAVAPAPEPDAWALMIIGVGLAGLFLRHARSREDATA